MRARRRDQFVACAERVLQSPMQGERSGRKNRRTFLPESWRWRVPGIQHSVHLLRRQLASLLRAKNCKLAVRFGMEDFVLSISLGRDRNSTVVRWTAR